MKTQSLTRYQQYAESIRERIRRGEYAAGDKLPSFAQMHTQGISQSTIERAHALLQAEGLIERRHKSGVYVASPQENSPLSTQSGFIGVPGALFRTQHRVAYDAELIHGFQNVLREAGKQIVLLDKDSPLGWDKVDALLLCGEERDAGRYLTEDKIWVSCLQEVAGIPSFVADDFGGARLLTQHLLALGHRRVACLMEAPERVNAKRPTDAVAERVKGWRTALEENGVTVGKSWYRKMFVPTKPYADYYKIGHYFVSKWLRDGWHKEGFTALVAQNDMTAMGAIQALREHGLRVPEDVSVTGFDGVEATREGLPPVTTVYVPLQRLAADAASTLLRLLKGEEAEKTVQSYPVDLQVRASTAPAPG